MSQAGLLVYCESLAQGGTTLTWRDRHGVETPLPGQMSRAWGTGTLSPDGRRVAERDPGRKGLGYLGRGPRARHADASDVRRHERQSHLDAGRPHHRLRWEQGRQSPDSTRCRPTAAGSPQLILADDRSGADIVHPGRQDAVVLSARPIRPVEDHGASRSMPLAARRRRIRSAKVPRPISMRRSRPTASGWRSLRQRVAAMKCTCCRFPGSGAKVQVSADGAQRSRWSGNGRELFFWGRRRQRSLFSSAIQTVAVCGGAAPAAVHGVRGNDVWRRAGRSAFPRRVGPERRRDGDRDQLVR